MLTASIALAAERQRQEHPNAAAFLAASSSLMRVVGQRRRYWEIMAAVRVPVLLIGGEADRLVPAASMRQAAARNPHWETVMLPGVGHALQLEVPGSVIGTVRDWLGRTTPGTRCRPQEERKCSNSPAWMPRSSPSRQPTPPATSGG
jgi:pimeloyl-ACP methyl ester carboxylesterase